MSQVSALKVQIKQLRQEASVQRIPVSKACDELIKFCQEHQKNDILVMGISQSENPFKEAKGCVVL